MVDYTNAKDVISLTRFTVCVCTFLKWVFSTAVT